MFVHRPVREAEIRTIVALSDSSLRNLWITLAYHDLATGMMARLDHRDLSWCAFSTWASKTAGAAIRGELGTLLFDRIKAWLVSPPFSVLLKSVSKQKRDAVGGDEVLLKLNASVDHISELIAQGNLRVFLELGPPFARMLTLFDKADQPDPGELNTFLTSVVAIDDDPVATECLREAFGRYYFAMFDPDAKSRAEGVLLANGLNALTEQRRLQSVLEKALEAPVEDIRAMLQQLLGPLAPVVAAVFIRDLQRIWRQTVSEFLLTLKIPGGALALGQDVPCTQRPAELKTLTNPGLVALFREYDRTDGTAVGSGAHDWASLADRMNYIVNLFRCWQQTNVLLANPFTVEQIQAMQNGRIPGGPL
jgi:hypothetical protein